MRRLLLLRHAKAERLQSGGRDHDRVLTERGRADARKLGLYLARHAFAPDRAVVSSAARTRETWALLAAAFSKAPPVSFEERIYEATPQAILQVIKETGPETGTLLVIGHNPSLQELAVALARRSPDLARVEAKFPTGALVTLGFSVSRWQDLRRASGTLEAFVRPRDLTP